MGNSVSGHSHTNVFQHDLSKLNKIVNDIIGNDDMFKNKHYNFLSQDVCKNYKILLQDELKKHMKVHVKDLGTSLYIIPKHEDDNAILSTKHNMTKKQVCDKISNHYIKLLYIMCLIKHVYNTEKSGDLSIAGIVFRNIKIVDDMMQITFCNLPHKNYTNKPINDVMKIDFSHLEGLDFFTKYFLPPDEANEFIALLQSILARKPPKNIAHHICKHNIKDLTKIFKEQYPNQKLECQNGGANLELYVEKENPVFQADYCSASMKVTVKLNTAEGRKILAIYKNMKKHYVDNIQDIYSILDKLTYKSNGIYELKDINKNELDSIIDEVSNKVKIFYIQSLFDFQKILDTARKTPSIHIT